MSVDLDPDIIEDFFNQINDQTEVVNDIINNLKNNLTKSELFISAGQVADRIYGAISMFDFKEFSEYCLKIKEMSYKCSNSDPEHTELRTKCFDIIRNFPGLLGEFKLVLKNDVESIEITRKYHLETKKIDKILVSYLHNISAGSVAYEDNRTYVYVYDKLGTISANYKAENRKFDPEPKFFNAYVGLKKNFGKNPEEVCAIIIETQSDSWEPLIKDIKLIMPNVPIMLAVKNKRGMEDLDKFKLGIDSVILSHMKYSKILEELKEINKKTKNRTTLSEKKEENKDIIHDDVVSVSPKIFKNGQPSQFDVYVMLNNQKFIKVIEAHEPFDTSLIEKHIERKISKYFILKRDYQKYCDGYETELERLYNDPTTCLAKRKESLLDHADSISYFVEENGVNQKALDSAQKFIEQSEKIICEIVKEKKELKVFLDDISNMQHGVALCLMSGLFLNSIKATSDTYNDVTLLCFFHDIGMRDLPEKIKNTRPELLNDEELIQYQSHPKISAQILAELNFKPALVQAASQHHIRRDGSGFPKLSKDIAFNSIAELIGLAEDFITTIEDSKKENLNAIAVFKEIIKNRFSKKLQDVFNLTFKGI